MVSLIVLLCTVYASAQVWPLPQTFHAAGEPVQVSPGLRVTHNVDSARFLRGVARHEEVLSTRLEHPSYVPLLLSKLTVEVHSADEKLSGATLYNYSLEIRQGVDNTAQAAVVASSIYGAMYALETFTQLVDRESGRVAHSEVTIYDAPDFDWRGLMIDSGRRFFPMPLVEDLLDTMAANKLNVLHLHASDHCRFGVESKLFPNLTSSLTGIHAGFYTQADVASMIAYAGDRGIRVIPEFDVPGHSRGFLPLEANGLEFCTSEKTRSQLYGDPKNKTLGIITSLFKEMASLFTDEVFNIGSDETSAKGRCTVDSTFKFEREVLNYVQNVLGKTPAGWEEVYFDAGAATPETIVDAWSRHTPEEITKTGRKAIESSSAHFYFTSAAPGGPAGWKTCWYDIAAGVPSDEKKLLLGGEMSMWSDRYCYIDQCGSSTGALPPGHVLFDPKYDVEFGESIGGMIWPRGYVGAGAFWNYNASTDPSSDAFVSAIYKLNDDLASRGRLVCPSRCSCDYLSACGKPYVKAAPPVAGTALSLTTCTEPVAQNQQFGVSSTNQLVLSANTSLCVPGPGTQGYPLALAPCSGAGTYSHVPANGELRSAAGLCLDVRVSDSTVGAWACGSTQPNQAWSVDPVTKTVVSLLDGKCLTAA